MTVSLDLETRSISDLKKAGAYKYMEHPSTDGLCYAFKVNKTPIIGIKGMQLHEDLRQAVVYGHVVNGWNVTYEYLFWNKICVPKYGWPPLPAEQLSDTMARAAAMNLPQALGECAKALRLGPEYQKDKRGEHLITLLSKPISSGKKKGQFREDPELLEEMNVYCQQDVKVEDRIGELLSPLSKEEQEAWLGTLRINDRGLPVDLYEIANVIRVVEQEKEYLNQELYGMTGIASANKRAQVMAHVLDSGLDIPDLTGDTIKATLAGDDITDHQRRVLEIRDAVSQTSTAKFGRMVELACNDGRIHGLLTYHGASTGRDASRGLNAQNLARPPLKHVDAAIASITEGTWDACRAMWGDQTMAAAVSSIRGVIKAPDGYDFLDADYSSAENRVASWIAGQQDKIDAFAAGIDEYKQFAVGLYNVEYGDVTKDMRQVAKSAVLGCFAAGTKVLTDSGWKAIERITRHDRVHDGIEFVTHAGVAYRGVKSVVNLGGVLVTPDHKILEGDGDGAWVQADSVNLNRATSMALGLLSGTSGNVVKLKRMSCVIAEQRQLLVSLCFGKADRLNAVNATTPRGKKRRTHTVTGGWLGGLLQYTDALIATAKSGLTTAAEALRSISTGLTTQRLSLGSSALCPDGTIHHLRWTESTITSGITRRTCGLRQDRNRTATGGIATGLLGVAKRCLARSSGQGTARGTHLKELSSVSCVKANRQKRSSQSRIVAEVPTFDIINAGTRSRFVVLTDEGPVIAHNCMFGQGWKGLIAYAEPLGVHLDDEESQKLTSMYRAQYPMVQKTWYACGDAMMDACESPGTVFPVGKHIAFKVADDFLKLRLPSGRLLHWYQPRVVQAKTPWGAIKDAVETWIVNSITRKWERRVLIGSSAFQSSVQAAARDLLIAGVKNLEAAGYPVVLRVHDEVLSLVPEGTGDENEFGQLLCKAPAWAGGLPLAFEAWRGKRFRK